MPPLDRAKPPVAGLWEWSFSSIAQHSAKDYRMSDPP